MDEDELRGRSEGAVRLRAVRRTDLRWLAEMACDPALVGEHNWNGEHRPPSVVENELQRRFDIDGLAGIAGGRLIVELDDGTAIGDVAWRTEQWGPTARSRCPAFGISLMPQFRGRGYGTAAQRLVVDHLFGLDADTERVQSDTATDNLAERRALAKIGMVQEGVVRHAEYRDGVYHDHLLFSVLRSEWEAQRAAEAADGGRRGNSRKI